MNYKENYESLVRDSSAVLSEDKRLEKETVALVFGGCGPEKEVSWQSAKLAAEALQELGYSFNMIEIDPENRSDNSWTAQLAGCDVALVLIHGRDGEDGYVQAVLQGMQIPYTGSGTMGSALCYNKFVTKQLWRSLGGLTAEALSFNIENYLQVAEHVFSGFSAVMLPVVIKPMREGSSLGVQLVRSEEELISAMENVLAIDEQGLAEPLLNGREFTLGFLDEEYLGAIEIRPSAAFYDYKAKYESDDTAFLPLVDLREEVTDLVDHCIDFIRMCELESAIRFDFRMHAGRAYLLEVNTIPGMTSHSLLPMAAEQFGWNYSNLIQNMIQGARVKA